MNHSGVGRVFGLDVLRAIAILCVLFLHSFVLLTSTPALLRLMDPDKKALDSFFLLRNVLAYYGVELFFVLSGFLIGSILLSLAPSFKNPVVLAAFWQRRWMRTLPNYFLFLGVSIGLFLTVSAKLPDLLSYFVFLQNWLWVQPRFYLESWSLAIEEWFYFLFPITIFVFHRRMEYKKAFVLSALIFLILPTILRVIWAYTGHANWDEEFRKIVVLRLDSIMYGVLAAQIKSSYPVFWKKYRNLLLLAGLGILCIVFLYFAEIGFTTFLARTFMFSAISLGMSFLLPFFDQWQVSKENILTQSFRYVALWSYSLYLCNVMVAFAVNMIYTAIGQETILISITVWFTFYILCFLASGLLYRYFEKPIMDLREHFSISLPKAQDDMRH